MHREVQLVEKDLIIAEIIIIPSCLNSLLPKVLSKVASKEFRRLLVD